jgi:hypothetical protein
MKKILPLLLCSLVAFSACKMEDSYTQTNVQDLVTVKGDNLVNDYGYVLTVTQDAVGRSNWQIEGARYFALFDILNRQFDISLKEMVRSIESVVWEYDETVEYATDPVSPFMVTFSGGYLNLGLEIAKVKKSDNAHPIRFYYELDNSYMKLHVVHDGDGEDLRNWPKDDLDYVDRVYHISNEVFDGCTKISLIWHYLDTDASGNPVLKESTYDFR